MYVLRLSMSHKVHDIEITCNMSHNVSVKVDAVVLEATCDKLVLQTRMVCNEQAEKCMDVTFQFDEPSKTMTMTKNCFYKGDYQKEMFPDLRDSALYTIISKYRYAEEGQKLSGFLC